MDVYTYAARCEELFGLSGYAQVRAVAEEGMAELGPDPVLTRWLGLAHAAEEDDDHDVEAEAVYEAGLRQWPDELGLLVSYLELCLRSDGWEFPARAKRAGALKERIAELAPPGSPEAAQVEAAMGWAGRGYWADTQARAVQARADRADRDSLRVEIASAVKRDASADGPAQTARPEDLRAAEVAAVLEELSGARNAPLRLLARYRPVAYGVALVLAIATNKALAMSGAVSFSVWGWFWFLLVLVADARVKQARKMAAQRVIAAVEARHAAESVAGQAGR
ncbi:hypothetical protein [Streptomyces sp. NPDC051561]|uniref:hypothetical protein n=1 Tax=Streptomyces sp. NPDC051561 TaxID=3365658 RepID=UPI0037985B65